MTFSPIERSILAAIYQHGPLITREMVDIIGKPISVIRKTVTTLNQNMYLASTVKTGLVFQYHLAGDVDVSHYWIDQEAQIEDEVEALIRASSYQGQYYRPRHILALVKLHPDIAPLLHELASADIRRANILIHRYFRSSPRYTGEASAAGHNMIYRRVEA